MSARARSTAAAAVVAALVDHALDASGRLPFVHESHDVRTAMGPGRVLAWLALSALLMGCATRRRPAVFGPVAALVTAGLPELVSRADPGAVFEPGALLGALLQWLILLTVLALAAVVEQALRIEPLAAVAVPAYAAMPTVATRGPRRSVRGGGLRSRAPPAGCSAQT